MTKDEVKAILDRVPSWPLERQEELAEIALELEAEATSEPYVPTPEEARAIDEALASGVATDEQVKAAFGRLRRE